MTKEHGTRLPAQVRTVHRSDVSDFDRGHLKAFYPHIDWEFGPEMESVEFYGRPDWRTMVHVGNRLVAHAGVAERIVTVGGTPMRVAGVCSVASLPDVRGQGFAALAMRHTINHACAHLSVDFGLLACLLKNAPFYQKLGWSSITNPVQFLQITGRIPFPPVATMMIYSCGECSWPTGLLDLEGLPW